VSAAVATERAFAAREFGSGRYAVTWPEARYSFGDFENPRTKFVTEELNGRLRLQSPLNAFKCESRDAKGELRFRDTRLNTQDFRQNMTGLQCRQRHFVEAHIAETIESPGSH
jgi:hypothetical protein